MIILFEKLKRLLKPKSQSEAIAEILMVALRESEVHEGIKSRKPSPSGKTRFTRKQARELIATSDALMKKMPPDSLSAFKQCLYNCCYKQSNTTEIAGGAKLLAPSIKKGVVMCENNIVTLSPKTIRVAQILYFHICKIENKDFNLYVTDLDLDSFVYHTLTE